MVTPNRCLLLFLNFLLFSLRSFGFLDIDEIKNTHYGIELLKTPVVVTQEASAQMVLLSTIHGQKYRCNYPDHSISQEEAEEREAEQIGIPDLLKPMEDGPCIITTKDWWTYEFCYGKYLQQYHMEDGVPVGKVIYLGFYESEYNWRVGNKQEMKQNKERLNRYHSQQYSNGTVCDLTNKPRKVEVRFLCDEGSGDYISRIDEPESCGYVLTVHTTKICHHPYLKPLSPSKPLPITCNPVLDAEQYQEYLDDQEAERVRAEALAHERKKYSAEANKDLEGKEEGPNGFKDAETKSAAGGEEKEAAGEGRDSSDIVKTFEEAMVNSVKKDFGGGLDGGSDGEGLDFKMHFKVVKSAEDIERLIKEMQGGSASDLENDDDDLPPARVAPPVELMPSEEFIDRSPTEASGSSSRNLRQETATGRGQKMAPPDYNNRLTKVKTQMERFNELIYQNKKDNLDSPGNTQPKDADREFIQEFDKGVEQLVKEGHIREKMASMKNKINNAVSDEFGNIVDEAQAELRREGFDGPINRKEAFINLASTLDKLLNHLEKSNKELDEVDTRLREAAESAKKSLLEQRMKSAELLQKMREKAGGKLPEGAADNEKLTEDNVLKQIEKSNADLENRLREARENKLAAQKFLQEQRERSAEILKKMQEKQVAATGSAAQEKPLGAEEKEDEVEPHKPQDNTIRVRVMKVKLKEPNEPVEKQASPTDTKSVLGDAQKQKLENSVREELKKAGLDKSGKKIHIKIITSMPTDGTGFQVTDEDSAAFNKMIVTILGGGNQDEVREQERQLQFEDSYNFVYKPQKKKKEATPVIP